eukprot:TRINITY_DN1340_c0_g1_i1.p1 TRINITY_DN1340_c0_g1~~TRINITY_DN1340_c0_g1_i1.p1  ORF type:complete len:173 (-),score=23.03 TRINITY_DN1340_c0_g1_i1:83-601(-)
MIPSNALKCAAQWAKKNQMKTGKFSLIPTKHFDASKLTVLKVNPILRTENLRMFAGGHHKESKFDHGITSWWHPKDNRFEDYTFVKREFDDYGDERPTDTTIGMLWPGIFAFLIVLGTAVFYIGVLREQYYRQYTFHNPYWPEIGEIELSERKRISDLKNQGINIQLSSIDD